MERVTRQYAEVLTAGDGKQRVGRQYAEVLTAGDGKARVGRQYVEVLCEAAIFNVALSDSLGVTHGVAATRIMHVEFTDDLGLVQSSVEQGPRYEAVQSSLGLCDQVDVQHLAVYCVSLTDTLTLTQTLGKRWPVSLCDTLCLTDEAMAVDQLGVPVQDLGITDEIIAVVVHRNPQQLELTDSIACQLIATRAISHDLGITQSLAYEVDSRNVTQQYMPFVGSSDDPNYTPPTTVPPVLGRAVLTLTYPFAGPTTTLVLRNPEFGNLNRLTFNRVNRKTRGGTLVVFADPHWPKVETLQVKITYLSQQQADDLIAFLRLSLGQEIGLLDHEGRQWRGVITTPDAEISNPGREDRSIGFDFEGVLA